MPGANLGGGYRGCTPPEMTCGFQIQLVFSKKKNNNNSNTPFLTGAPPPKKNPGSYPECIILSAVIIISAHFEYNLLPLSLELACMKASAKIQ